MVIYDCETEILYRRISGNAYLQIQIAVFQYLIGNCTMDMAQNILVVKTVSGMASAVCAAIDAMKFTEIVGSIAGDDTIMCAVRSVNDTLSIMKKIKKIVEQ